MDRIITIHGAGRHGHVVACAALANGWMVHYTDQKYGTHPDGSLPYIVAIGDNRLRKSFDGSNMVSVIHPSAYVDPSASLAGGVFVGPQAVVHISAKLGRGVIVNSGAIVEHDCVLNGWSHLSPGAVLCGDIEVGEGCWIGANAVVKQGLTIAPWTIVGCGAVVVKDITEPGTYVGNPAHRLRGSSNEHPVHA